MHKIRHLLWMLALARLVLPFLLQHAIYEPHRDAYLYLDYAYHMDWGYMEVPPLLSVFSWLTALFGGGLFWIKWWPALFGALTFWLCGDLVIRQGGGRYALLLLWISFVFGAFLRLFFLFQPGFLEVFSWTLIGYALIRYQEKQYIPWLYVFGVACAVGMLSKYTTAFFIVAVIAALFICRQFPILFNRHFFLAAMLGLLLFAPNLWWQYQHHFPVVNHMRELHDTQLIHMDAGGFLGGQAGMHFIVAWVWLSGFFALLLYKPMRAFRWYAVTFMGLLALLIAGKGKDYYALGAYPLLFVFGSIWLHRKLTGKVRILRYTLPALAISAGIWIIPLGLPVFTPAKLAAYYKTYGFTEALGFTWEDQQKHPLPQDFADMTGWEALTEMVAKQYHALPDSARHQTIIFCRGYYTTGAINYFGKKWKLPRAHSDNGSYLAWVPSTFDFRHVLLVGHRYPDADDIVFTHFEKGSTKDSLHLPLFREDGIRVFLFENAGDSVKYYAEKGLAAEKARFNLK